MLTLEDRIKQHPIADKAYVRHLRTADVFNEVTEARKVLAARRAWLEHYESKVADAEDLLEAALAKAKLMEAMEDL